MTTNLEWHRGDYVLRETITAKEARDILAKAKERGLVGMAKINKSLTKQQAWDIFSVAISKDPEDQPLLSIIAKNIRREFGG